MTKYLNRKDAFFSDEVWEAIDSVVVNAAKSQLSARRILEIKGPYGIGRKSLTGKDREINGLIFGETLPIAYIKKTFTLSVRDIVDFEENKTPMDLSEVAEKSIEIARMEDDLIYKGHKGLGIKGLLQSEVSYNLDNWDEPGVAADNIIEAITNLDENGFHGPYYLALSSSRYNKLYRRYQQGMMTEYDHISKMVEKIVKAPSIESGGVLLNKGPQYAHIVIGQDLYAGFIGPSPEGYDFSLSESLTIRILNGQSVCVLK
jgi:uncharacterized linocin/CFP29 family protein